MNSAAAVVSDSFLGFASEADAIKNEIARNYLTIKAHEKAISIFSLYPGNIDFRISRAAFQLSKEAYSEYKEKLTKKYHDSIYKNLLSAYIKNNAGFFEIVLKNEIKKEMKKKIEELSSNSGTNKPSIKSIKV